MTVSSKKEARELFEKHRKTWLEIARAHARTLATKLNRPITVDDLKLVVSVPDGVDLRVYGAVFKTTEWEAVGRTFGVMSSHDRPSRIVQWQLRSAA